MRELNISASYSASKDLSLLQSTFLILPPLKTTSPRQSRGTLGAQRLWQLNLQSKIADK